MDQNDIENKIKKVIELYDEGFSMKESIEIVQDVKGDSNVKRNITKKVEYKKF